MHHIGIYNIQNLRDRSLIMGNNSGFGPFNKGGRKISGGGGGTTSFEVILTWDT